MKAGRESVWLVVPFTVGIAVVNYSLPVFYAHPSVAVAVLSAAVAGLALCFFPVWKGGVVRNVAEKEKDSDILEILCGAAPKVGLGRAEIWRRRLVFGIMFFLVGVTVCVLANLAELVEVWRFGTVSADGGYGSGDLPSGVFGADVSTAVGDVVRPSRIRLFTNNCGERFRNMIDGMPFGDILSNALVKALLSGDRSGLGRDIRSSFRAAGASHLLALSGLHLSVIYLVISKILSLTGNSPAAVKSRSVLIILFSGFFTLITGASPSLMRAFLFIALRECAVLSRRRTDNINIFCMSLMLQLALNPNDISSVGFQLSYLAMLGIFILNPPLERFWDLAGDWLETLRREKKTTPEGDGGGATDVSEDGSATDGLEGNVPKNSTSSLKDGAARMGTAFGSAMRKIWSLCSLSISCQAFTAPAVLLYFGTFPTYFLLTNLLCLPLSNVLITVSVIAVLLQMLGLCPSPLLSLIDFLVHTLLYILDTIAGM